MPVKRQSFCFKSENAMLICTIFIVRVIRNFMAHPALITEYIFIRALTSNGATSTK
jgi:hypothetical protein